MANRLFQAFIDTAKTIAGYPITVANAVFMRDGSTLDEFSENIPHREDDEDTNIEVPNIDADMLNGHPADYYSKQSDLSALNTSVTQVNNKIGNTDVSKWGNSLTGAIKAACDKSDANETAIADVNSNLNKLVIYSNTAFLTAADGRIQLQTDYKPDKPYFLCCQFPNGFTGDIAQIDTNGLIVANYIYAPNATERFNGDLWVNLFGVFKVK